MSCTCTVECDPTPDSVETIIYCPTHEAAGEMEKMLHVWRDTTECDAETLHNMTAETDVILARLDGKGEAGE